MQPQFYNARRGPLAGVLAATLLAAGAPGRAVAHEGHAALPSTGATVEGDQVLVSEGARKGLGLKTAVVMLADLTRTLRVRARVELPWDGRALVSTLVPGRVREILVAPGERVEAGQELARIESLELEALQLSLLQADQEVALTRRLVEQRRPLAASGAIAGKVLLEAQTQLRQKRVQLAIAERKLTALGVPQETLEQVRASGEPVSTVSVTSPLGGIVASLDVRVGGFVDTEQQLFKIVDRSRVVLAGEVLETDVWNVEPGQAVKATFTALPDRSFAGKIDHLGLSIGSEQRTLEAKAHMDNPDGALRPGMSGRMQITVSRAKQAIVCPAAALLDTPERTFVLLQRGAGKYKRREIEIGLRTPERVEVLDGLFPGDRVVVTGAKLLASLFHTDGESEAKLSQHEATRASTSSSGELGGVTSIPVAQAVVELPPTRKAFATPVIEGRVAAIYVHPGDAVQAGQLLAEIDSQQLRSLQLELLETQEALRRTTATIEQVEPASRSGSFPQTQLWQLQMEQRASQIKLQNIKRKVAMVGLPSELIDRLARVDLSRDEMDLPFASAPVLAPIAGRVADFDVALGQVVHANDALFEIQDARRIWIKGYVFEQHAAQVEAGQTAEIQIPAFPQLEITGTVVRTAPTLHASARVLPVWIEVENPGSKLREGMLATVEIVPQTAGRRVAVRPQAND